MKKLHRFCFKLFLLGSAAVLTAPFLRASAQAAGGRIVYYTNVPDNGSSVHYQIYIINGDGTGNTRLNRASDDLSPALSPDGTKIAFVSSLGSGVYLMNPDGSGAVLIPNSDGFVHPNWSPDGSAIVGSKNGGIAVVKTDGSGLRMVTPSNNPVATYPSWSPDGTKIAFQGYTFASRSTKVYVVDADGASAPVILSINNDTGEYHEPSWSPDGTKIVSQRNGVLVLLNSTTGAETPGRSGVGSPTFSPDGTQIAFQDNNGSTGLAVMNLDGTNFQAYNTPRANYPKWSRAAAPTPPPGPTSPPHGGLSATTFTVNESSSPAANVNDTVLRFRAVQLGTPAGLSVRVQANGGTGWVDLPDGLSGLMVYAPQVTGYILHSTNYPIGSAISFRAISKAPGYPDSISNVVGPFGLTQNRPHLGPTLLFVTTNGEINAIRFGVNESAIPSGTFVRVQTTKTPALEDSWSDVTINNTVLMTQDASDPHQFYSGTDNYPDGEGVYFRAVASDSNGAGYVNSISIPYGPFKFVTDPPAVVSIKVNGESNAPNDIDGGYLLPSGSFNMQANASSGRLIKRLTLLFDGVTIGHFDNGATSGALNYTSKIPGDHLIEAYATDDLGVTGAAPPIHVRILPPSPGKVFRMQNSGDWNDAGNWIDAQGNPGVPGLNDFAIVSTFSPTLTTDVTVKAMSLNGGMLNGARTLTVTGFCTIADGAIKGNLTIPSGATCELLNDSDITLTGTFNYAGTVRLHGKGGIGGVNTTAARSALTGPNPGGFFDFIGGIIRGAGQFFVDLAAGGKRGSKARPAPAPSALAPEKRAIKAAQIQIPAGKVTVVPPPAFAVLISQDGGGVISRDGAGVISRDGAGLVASGGGNLVASGGGNLVPPAKLLSQDGGGLVASGGGNLVASGGGNLLSQDGGGLVASGGGNLVASGGGNRPALLDQTAEASAADAAGLLVTGGELDLTELSIYGSVAIEGGILSGSGIIIGDLTNQGGFISPGHSAGAIAVTRSFAQGEGGTLIFENGGAAPDKFDQLLIGGAANLGGRLDVKLINGYTPDIADTFSPLGYGTVSGTFAAISSNAQATLNANGLLISANPNAAQPAAGQLRNISTRVRVQTGDNVMIAGFIITGSAPKQVIIRALGPELVSRGVGGVLADPTLELHEPNGTVVSNDNWKQNQQGEIEASTLAPRFESESAIIATLVPGVHTAIVRGKGDTTGVGLVEVYDLDPTSTSTLGNIATRGLVQTGDNVLIGGIIVGGTEPARVLVRAVGPSLTARGVAGALQDPELELHDSNGGTISNGDWRETQETDIVATTLAPSNDRESAVLATLVPGIYTAIVRGKDNTTGVGLIEAYNVK